MEHTSTASIKVARGILAALFALSVYRAMTQSVTPGEALTYNLDIASDWTPMFSHFDGNNRVLNSLLVRLLTARLHVTELWLRMPSLLCGLLYLAAVWKLARRFGTGLTFLAVVGLLSLHPMLVDALSEASGYGIGLAFWCWGLELLIQSSEVSAEEAKFLQAHSVYKLNLAGVCLGLSVAAALAFIAPACALILVFSVWSRGRGGVVAGWAFLTAFVLLVLPLNHAEWKTLAAGATSLRQTINELVAITSGSSGKLLAALARVFVGLTAVGGAAAAVKWWRSDSPVVVLTGGTLALSLTILLLAHAWYRVPFPQAGSIYVIPIISLLVVSIIVKLNLRYLQISFLFVSALLIGLYVSELPTGMYASGRRFAGGRALAEALQTALAGKPARIGASAAAVPILEFYKMRYRQGNWQVVGPVSTGETDFYVLVAGTGEADGHRHVVYRDLGLSLLQPN